MDGTVNVNVSSLTRVPYTKIRNPSKTMLYGSFHYSIEVDRKNLGYHREASLSVHIAHCWLCSPSFKPILSMTFYVLQNFLFWKQVETQRCTEVVRHSNRSLLEDDWLHIVFDISKAGVRN